MSEIETLAIRVIMGLSGIRDKLDEASRERLPEPAAKAIQEAQALLAALGETAQVAASGAHIPKSPRG
jgi:hypothetical protein